MSSLSTFRNKIGVFDSGIGGFSVLKELFVQFPEAEYYYFSDDAYAPYGPLSDEKITERALFITNELLNQGVSLIVVACNTATASSIDQLRSHYPAVQFVGVEPYLNAYYKESPDSADSLKMAVLTTESMGKSNRFKRLKERLDPSGVIAHYSLKNLAKMVEDLYYSRLSETDFQKMLELELAPLKNEHYSHIILGCTHYPLVRKSIEKILHSKTLSPCPYVASRVKELLKGTIENTISSSSDFYFYSSNKPNWVIKSRQYFLTDLLT